MRYTLVRCASGQKKKVSLKRNSNNSHVITLLVGYFAFWLYSTRFDRGASAQHPVFKVFFTARVYSLKYKILYKSTMSLLTIIMLALFPLQLFITSGQNKKPTCVPQNLLLTLFYKNMFILSRKIYRLYVMKRLCTLRR